MDYCSEQTFSCSICSENFNSIQLLIVHALKIHGSEDCTQSSYIRLQDYIRNCYANLLQENVKTQNIFVAKSGCLENNETYNVVEQLKYMKNVTAKTTVDDEKNNLKDFETEQRDPSKELFIDSSTPDKRNGETLNNTETNPSRSRLQPPTDTGGKFPCRLCPRIFQNLRALKSHNREHMTGAPYLCNVCTFNTDDRGHLIRHLKQHNGLRPYQCAVCRYLFTTKANCERHLKNRHRLRSRHSLLATVIHLNEEENTDTFRTSTPPITPNSDEELNGINGGIKLETRCQDEAVGSNCLICKTRPCNSPNCTLQNQHQNAVCDLLYNNPTHGSFSIETTPYSTPHNINAWHASNFRTPESRDRYSFKPLTVSTTSGSNSEAGDAPLDLSAHKRTSIASQKEAVGNTLGHTTLTKPTMGGINLVTDFTNYFGMISNDWRSLVELSQHRAYLTGCQKIEVKGSSYKKKIPLPRTCPVSVKRKPKPKQRRYRTEKPFSCQFCSGRFTLSTNLERHIKNHHPEKWQRKPKKNK